ncbi:hypothetical protein Ddye_008530 [Dipteronia dyeriana]|uniref:Uncharacterized protein n=1 Tax=Dipteronia dyeriana TaxID=168575 RepID=A0AAD9XAK2_9ROSI|nr:hypothetical protein Ddye_008530 [Dipteronia dyeriana]
MALLGMQADMQCKSYFPGHYSTVDLNMDTSGSLWPFYNVDTVMKSEQYCNGTLSRSSPNQHWVYSKEALKQTMLMHQATFKDQIHELHRLYWRQRELMDEMKRNKLQNNLNLETLQSNPHLSQKSCDFTQKQCHVLSLPRVNPACNQLFVSTAESSLLLSNFNEGKSTHTGLDPAESKFALKDCQLESNCKKFGKKILNLELPAYEYIDSEEEKSIEKVPEVSGSPQGKISEVEHMSNQQYYHGNTGFNSVLQKDYLTPDTTCFKNNHFADLNEPHKLEKVKDPISTFVADLNEPINLEEEATPMAKFLADLNEPLQKEVASRSRDFPSLSTGHMKLPYQDQSQNSNSDSQVLPMDVMQNTKLRRDPEPCSNCLQPQNNKMQEWPSYDDEAGQSRSKAASFSLGFSEEVSKSFEDVDLKDVHELPSSFVMDQSKKISDSEGLQSLGSELSPSNYPEWVSCLHLSHTDVGNSKESLVLNWRKHVHDFVQTPIAIQALPCFTSSVPLSKSFRSPIASPWTTGKKSHYSRNLKSCPKFDGTEFYQHSYGSNSEPKTLESPSPSINCIDMDCNTSDDLTSEQHGPVKGIKPSMDVKPAKDMDPNCMSHSCSSDAGRIEDAAEDMKCGKRSESLTQVESILLQANSACIFDTELNKVEASNNSSSKRLLGGEQLTSDKLVAGAGFDKNISGFGIGIDLNSCIDEHESSPTPPLLEKLDLEAPASPENKESSPPRGESEENQVGTPCQMLGQEDGDVREEFDGTAIKAVVLEHEDRDAQEDLLCNLVEGVVTEQEVRDAQEDLLWNLVEGVVSGQEGGNVQDEIVRNAAEAIISFSSSKVETCSEVATCGPSEPCFEDLYWFSMVVSQVEDDPNSEFGVVTSYKDSNDDKDCLSNELDYFEAMTLQLAETKLEELWCMTNDQKDKKEEAMGATSLPCQPRRGQMRRVRQQRKDFQSEILPSLASLSRCEVTADLQTIEGLIEAANNSLRTDSSRTMDRYARARGGRRSYNSTSKVKETTFCSQSKPQTGYKEKGKVEKRVIGWGNITRRRRGPRCPASNARVVHKE